MTSESTTQGAVTRLIGARDEGSPVMVDQALARLESWLFGKPERPVTIDRYLIIRRLGEGGMGIVYLAYDPRLDRKVAIKHLKPSCAASLAENEGHARLLREAKVMARSPHPNVVAVYDVDTRDGEGEGGGVYIAMEYVEGPTLRDWLAHERPWTETIEVFIAAGRGLAAAHEVGVVHRDFKPGNVIVGLDGRVRVLDFGLAFGTAETDMGATWPSMDAGQDETLTVDGTVVGTPSYMAPEQHLGEPADAASDQYAFCVALWEGIYGRRPFQGSTVEELAQAKRRGPTPPSIDTRLPKRLEAIVSRGLAVESGERWPSMDALIDALKRAGARRRWGWGVAAGGLALAVGLGAAMASGGPVPDERCTGSDGRVEAVWNAQRREAVEDAFSSSGQAYADDVFGHVATRFDAFGSDWAEQHREACEATNVRGEQSRELMDVRMVCLDGQLRDLDALLGVFETADDEVVRRAVRASHRLPDPSECADLDALLAEVPPPKDEKTRQEVEELRHDLSRARALERSGKVVEGRALADSLSKRASAVGYTPVLAEVLLGRGLFELKAGEAELATKTALQAHTTALAAGHDKTAGKAASLLVSVLGTSGDLDEALRWAEVSAAALERGHAGDYERAMLLNALSNANVTAGRLEDALEAGTQALELVNRVAPEDPFLAVMHSNLGEILRRLGRLDEAQAQHERALALFEASGGPSHPDVAMAHNNLGNVHNVRGDLEAAAGEYRIAAQVREEAYGPQHPRVATTLANLGIILRRQGKLEEADRVYSRALGIMETAEGKDAPQLGGLLNGMAQVARERGEMAKAATVLERAVQVQEDGLGPDHIDLTYALRNLGLTYRDLERFADSVAIYERAQAILATSPDEQAVALGDTRYELARTLRAAGREREAREKAEQALGELPEGADSSLEDDLRGFLEGPA